MTKYTVDVEVDAELPHREESLVQAADDLGPTAAVVASPGWFSAVFDHTASSGASALEEGACIVTRALRRAGVVGRLVGEVTVRRLGLTKKMSLQYSKPGLLNRQRTAGVSFIEVSLSPDRKTLRGRFKA